MEEDVKQDILEGKTIMSVILYPDNHYEMKSSLSNAETVMLIEKIKMRLISK